METKYGGWRMTWMEGWDYLTRVMDIFWLYHQITPTNSLFGNHRDATVNLTSNLLDVKGHHFISHSQNVLCEVTEPSVTCDHQIVISSTFSSTRCLCQTFH